MGFKREGLVAFDPDREIMVYWCQGCECTHMVNIAKDGTRPAWGFNGNVEKPTLSPSVRTFWPARTADGEHPARPEQTRCHHFLRDGVIEFLSDSHAHQVRGLQPLQPIPANYGGVD